MPRSRQQAAVPNRLGTGRFGQGRSPQQYSASLVHGLVILACFSAERQVRGIADMAEEVGMSRSTTHRYVGTLSALGYLEQLSKGRKYRLGSRVGDVGMAALNSLGCATSAQTAARWFGD
jgi:IclR family transcriptional regulator, pca regulon regulatory protein